MRQVKAHGIKSWNNGWQGRAACDRAIERSFRQTGRRVVEEQLADMGDPAEALGRQEILAELAAYGGLVDLFGSLPTSLEDDEAWLLEQLRTAV